MTSDEWKAAIADVAAVMNKHFHYKEFILYGAGIPGEGPHWKLSKYYDVGGWKLEFQLEIEEPKHTVAYCEAQDRIKQVQEDLDNLLTEKA